MPHPKGNEPVKYCEHCGCLMKRKVYGGRLEDLTRFKERKYCDKKCASLGHRKETPTISAFRKRAKGLRGDTCETCGETNNLQVHHIDGNPANNEPLNLMTLCNSCHMKWHWSNGKQPHKKHAVCKVCGKRAKRQGMCQKHWQRYMKYGDPLVTKKRVGLQFVLVRVTD